MEPAPQPPTLVVFDPCEMELLPDETEATRVAPAIVLDERDVIEFDSCLSDIPFSGTQAQYNIERGRVLGQLEHMARNYTEVRIGTTTLQWTTFLCAKALGLVYSRRGFITRFTTRVGTSPNFIKDASDAFFNFLRRIPGSGIPRLETMKFGEPGYLQMAGRVNELRDDVYQQMCLIWRTVTGQQAAADVRRRSSLSLLRDQVSALTAQQNRTELSAPVPPLLSPPPLPSLSELPAPRPPRGGRGRRSREE